jgi:modification target Cys-rich repeat protein
VYARVGLILTEWFKSLELEVFMRWNVWAFVTVVAVASLGGWACNHTDYMTGAPGGGGGGSSIGAFVTVGAGGSNVFAPTAVTITHGDSVVFYYNSGFHTADVDDGTNTGTCADYNFESVAAGTAVTQVFSTAGTFPYHCDIHGSCTSGCVGPCSGMAGNVVVQ